MLKNFLLFQLTLAIIYAIAILGLNLLTGFNGQFSLGHSAFYAIGAYTAAILMDQADVAYYLDAAGAPALVCFVVGFLFGLPALRLRRHLSRARHLRARGGDAADPEVHAARRLDRRRAGHRHHQAGCRRSACRSIPTNGSIIFTVAVRW